MPYFKHDQALVDSANIGEGTKVWEFVHVLPGAVIGKNCNICAHVFIENDVIIGDNVTVKCGVQLWDGVRIHNKVFLGPNVTFTNDLRPRSQQHPAAYATTIINEGASVGANATIVAGGTIGKYAMIGAGAVVTKNVPNNTLWYGNPAVFKAYICNCGEKLDDGLNCGSCNKAYFLNSEGLVEEKR
ncbi:acyltransferase [Sporomusa aerivorans]|uniref:acyltransferase n=1 Tax=Sporomusa aerivorans TaxID=204936 RepID=UPI00352A1217